MFVHRPLYKLYRHLRSISDRYGIEDSIGSGLVLTWLHSFRFTFVVNSNLSLIPFHLMQSSRLSSFLRPGKRWYTDRQTDRQTDRVVRVLRLCERERERENSLPLYLSLSLFITHTYTLCCPQDSWEEEWEGCGERCAKGEEKNKRKIKEFKSDGLNRGSGEKVKNHGRRRPSQTIESEEKESSTQRPFPISLAERITTLWGVDSTVSLLNSMLMCM